LVRSVLNRLVAIGIWNMHLMKRAMLIVLAAVTATQVSGLGPRSAESAVAQIVDKAHASSTSTRPPVSRIPQLLQADPLAFLRMARQEYERKVRDYVCHFSKQERLTEKLGPRQLVDVKFREGPYSVFMHFKENPGNARRVLYVKDRIVKKGEQYAVIQPEGAIARLLVRSVERAVNGSDARSASRRTLADFGFARSLELIIQYAAVAQQQEGRSVLRFAGEGRVDGRPTYIIERRLPPEIRAKNGWPDTLLIVHLDQEWLVPVCCKAFSDLAGRRLVGEYVFTAVSFNVGLSDVDFSPGTYGL
jgi:hypothetical protein